MSVNCPDRECHFEKRILANCLFYDVDSSPNCSIPCHLEFCNYKIINDILCPVWHCNLWTTTTGAPTTTPHGPSPHPEVSTANIFSYCLNLLLIMIFTTIAIVWCKRRRQMVRLRHDEMEMTPIVRFSIDDSHPDLITQENENLMEPVNRPATSSSRIPILKKKEKEGKNEPKKFTFSKFTRNQEKFRVVFHKFLNQNFDETLDDADFLTQQDPADLEWFHELPQVEIQKL